MIGVAILGAGIGAQHLDGYRQLPDTYDVRWVIDLDVARARDMAGGIATSGDMQDALADQSVDIVDICLPPDLHVPVALRAMRAGKHVICEKPLATSLAEIDALRAAQQDTLQQVFPVFQYRFGRGFDALSALMKAGLTGAPRAASLETHWARDADYYANGWRGTWAGERGGAVLCHAIHAHDLLGHFMAPITSVSGAVATLVNTIETEDCAALSFTLDGGGVATSSITLGAARDETRLRFVFEHLTATSGTEPYAPGQGHWDFVARDPNRQADIDAVIAATKPVHSGFAGAFDHIAKAISGQPNAAVSFEDGAASVELVTAIYDAARNGHTVRLPLPQTHPMRGGWHP